MRTLFILLILSVSFQAVSQNETSDNQFAGFFNRVKDNFEGFNKNLGNNTFIYHSIRSDVNSCLLTRCTNGSMTITWQTAVVPSDYPASDVGFLWIAAYDISDSPGNFSLKFNGKERFVLDGKSPSAWKIKGESGSSLEFIPVETDINGDVHGYMSIRVPEQWIIKGKNQEISITGSAENNNKWVIVYQAADALTYLQKSSTLNTTLKMTFNPGTNGITAEIELPERYTGKPVYLRHLKKQEKINLIRMEGKARSGFPVTPEIMRQPLSVEDEYGILGISHGLLNEGNDFYIQKGSIINSSVKRGYPWFEMNSVRTYMPSLYNQLFTLDDSPLSMGNIYLMSSSHQDIAWMDSPEACKIQRDTMLLRPVFSFVQSNPEYRFDIEDALMIREYVTTHPEQKELVKKLLASGQVACGASFVQPYEEMYSGESLVRQFYLGKRWLNTEFNYNSTVYWNVDVPGRTLQMPQILKKSGVPYLMISRHKNGIFHWTAPDGSKVLTYSSGHYADAYNPLRNNFLSAADFISRYSLSFNDTYKTASNAVIPLLFESDMSAGNDFSGLIENWKGIKGKITEQNQVSLIQVPPIRYATSKDFFEAAQQSGARFPEIAGERPAVWLYIHGPSHYEAIASSRRGDLLLTAAEKFATANCLAEGNFTKYPVREFEKAWESKIYPDHGWGGNKGEITDSTFLASYINAEKSAKNILDKSLKSLVAKIENNGKGIRQIVVFNSTGWKRTDVVSFPLDFSANEVSGFEIVDNFGATVPFQLKNVATYPDGSLKSVEVVFTAENVPSIGYKTYSLNPVGLKLKKTKKEDKKTFENSFYRLKFGNGGIESIIDKEFNTELVDHEKFCAGEVFTLHSFGNGAGEFSDIQPVDMDGFDKTGNYKSKWKMEENGPVFTEFKMKQILRNTEVETDIVVYHTIKKIDFNISLRNFDGEPYREFRMALPLNFTNPQITYEVPFGSVTVGKDEIKGAAGERYTTDCKEVHPRGIENWISAGNPGFGVVMSSCVSVVDYIDPTREPSKNTVIQPILLASRKSCHSLGNFYSQKGSHTYSFSLTSGKPDAVKTNQFGRQSNEKLLGIVAEKQPVNNAVLPSELSFFSATDSNLIISTVKKAEGSDETVLRFYNISDQRQNAAIQFFKPIRKALKTSMLEYEENEIPLTEGRLTMPVEKYSIETIKLK